ncbi:MAG: HDOD domain-containing protein [Thermoguttaceae bacterium]|nr:HDOD domain-containing protein [Thermoguttaceae bacterium]
MKRIDDISTLPQIALRVMQVARDESVSAAELKAVMENDPALSARVLRCVNSAAYALRTRVTNLQQAISYLGTKQIRNLAMTACVSDMFRKDERIGPYRRRELWRHLVSVGIGARLIAMRRRLADFEDAFLAGLLHDVGIVLEDQHFHEAFRRVVGGLDGTRTLGAIEREVLGFDHMMLGERLAAAWGFPEAVRGAARHHHAAMAYSGESADVIRCVEVANLLCTVKGVPSVGVKLVKVCRATFTALSLSQQDLKVLDEDLNRELANNATLFSM